MSRTTIQGYMEETFNYGGEIATRAQIIADLKSQGADQRRINSYMIGLETRKHLDEQNAHFHLCGDCGQQFTCQGTECQAIVNVGGCPACHPNQ